MRLLTLLFIVMCSQVMCSQAATAAGMRVAMVQFDADEHFGDAGGNIARLTALIEQAAADGARLVVLPEGSTYGYATPHEVWCRPGLASLGSRRCRDVSSVAAAVPDGGATQAFVSVARRLNVFIVFSAIEAAGRDFYNAAVLVGPSGWVATYRKRELYYLDEGYAKRGQGPVVAQIPGLGSVGFLICADGNRDSYYRDYARQGVHTIITIMDWDQDPESDRGAGTFFAERAHVNGVTLLAADASAWDGTGAYFADRDGRVRDGLNEPGVGEVGVALVDLP